MIKVLRPAANRRGNTRLGEIVTLRTYDPDSIE